MESLGQRIQKEILKQHRSVKEVAEKAEIHRDSLSRIIRDQHNPRRDTVERIAGALEIDVDTLLKGPVKEDEMGRAVPGTKQYPVGHGVNPALPPDRERLEALQKALAIICTMEQRGEATAEERDSLTNVIARLEQAE